MRGWNWGTAKFKGDVLSFNINDKTSFEIPLSNVSQCNTGKNEITLEFHQNDDAPVSLMEMRYHIPTTESNENDPVDAFYQNVINKASVLSLSGDAIAIFREIQCLTPRFVVIATLQVEQVFQPVSFFLVVVTTSKYSNRSFSFTVKLLITKFRCRLSCVCFCCLTKTTVKCFSSSLSIHQSNKVKRDITSWFCSSEWKKKLASSYLSLKRN